MWNLIMLDSQVKEELFLVTLQNFQIMIQKVFSVFYKTFLVFVWFFFFRELTADITFRSLLIVIGNTIGLECILGLIYFLCVIHNLESVYYLLLLRLFSLGISRNFLVFLGILLRQTFRESSPGLREKSNF